MPHTRHLQEVLARYAAEHGDSASGHIARLLVDDQLDRTVFDAVVRWYGVTDSLDFRDNMLDLVLHVVRRALEDHCLTGEEREAIRRLTIVLGIDEGAFYERRRAEIRDVLTSQVRRLLMDEGIDRAEALHQVELQRLFGLGYDQYLELTRDEFRAVVDNLIARVTADDVVTAEEADQFRRHLSALDTVYRLSQEQREALARTARRPRPGSGGDADP